MYRVTLVNLTEKTKDSFEYGSLFDALRIAKNIDTRTPDDLMGRPAMSDEFFNENLWELLTMGFVYVREDVMVFLWKLDGNEECPVVSALDMFKGLGLTIPKPPEHSVISKETLPGMLRPPVEKPSVPGFPVEPLIKPPVGESKCDHNKYADCINCFVEPLEITNRLSSPVGDSNIVLGED